MSSVVVEELFAIHFWRVAATDYIRIETRWWLSRQLVRRQFIYRRSRSAATASAVAESIVVVQQRSVGLNLLVHETSGLNGIGENVRHVDVITLENIDSAALLARTPRAVGSAAEGGRVNGETRGGFESQDEREDTRINDHR